jgi:C1q domain
MKFKAVSTLLFMLAFTFSPFAQISKEHFEDGLSKMEKNGEIRREGNKIIFLKLSKGDTAFYRETYNNFLKQVPDNPYTIAFEVLPAKNTLIKNATPVKDTAKNYHLAPAVVKHITSPGKVAFQATITTPRVSPASPLRFDNILYNDGYGLNSDASVFRAPSGGLYSFSLSITWNGFGTAYGYNSSAAITILKNERESIWSTTNVASYTDTESFHTDLCFSTKLRAGDRLDIRFILMRYSLYTGADPTIRQARFSGYRVYEE